MTTATATTTWESILDGWLATRGYSVRERSIALDYGRRYASLRFCPALDKADYDRASRICLYSSLN